MTNVPEEQEDKRVHPRASFGNRTTGLIQALLADPGKVAEDLEADLRKGADVRATAALLSSARVFAKVRGIDLVDRVRDICHRLKKAGFDVRALEGDH